MQRKRVTLVTGSRSGIGNAVAALLANRGGHVIGLDIADANVVADLSTLSGRKDAVEQILALASDGLDAVIACAGLASDDGEKTVAVNYFGVTTILAQLRPLLAQSQAPRAVVVASSSNILPIDSKLVDACLDATEEEALRVAGDSSLAYSSSKRAITRWIRRTAVADGWANQGILLNGVAPGQVRTAMTEKYLNTEEGRAMLTKSVPHATIDIAKPADIAPLIAFLASEENQYMVGQVPFCDGGCDVLLRGDDVLTSAELTMLAIDGPTTPEIAFGKSILLRL